MQYIEHCFVLDIDGTASQEQLVVRKGDTARRLRVNFASDGRPYRIADGCYAVLSATKPDGHVLFNNCTIWNSNVLYDFTEQTVSAVGMMECEIIIYGSGGAQVTSAMFTIIVEDSKYKDFESSSEATALGSLISDVQALRAAVKRFEDGAVEDAVIDGLLAHIGDLSQLETTDKSSLVQAINEAAKSGGGGVYVGSGEMPEDYNIQIDPTGSADVAATREWVNNHVQEAIQNGADPVGTAERNVTEHNTSTDSHNDIRLIIDGLSNRLNALVNSSDDNLEKIAELVEYINANKDLIDGITTNKVNVSDIIDNLTTNAANKPLSAAQGVALRALIDAITIPTKLSQLTNDTGYLTQHQSLSGYAKTSDIKKWTLAQIQAAINATWEASY